MKRGPWLAQAGQMSKLTDLCLTPQGSENAKDGTIAAVTIVKMVEIKQPGLFLFLLLLQFRMTKRED